MVALTLAACTTGPGHADSKPSTPVPRPTGPTTVPATTAPATTAPATTTVPVTTTRPATTTPPATTTSETHAHAARCTPPPSTWSAAALANELLMVVGSFTQPTALRPEAAAGVGGFVFLGEPPESAASSLRSDLATLVAEAASHARTAPWMSTDTEGGPVSRLRNVLGPIPSARAMAAQWSPAQVERVMAARGAAMRREGITMDLAPVLDTASPTNTVASETARSFSDTPTVVARFGMAFAAGLRSAGVVAVGKHFPGLGHASADTDTGPATDPPIATLRAHDLLAYNGPIAAGLPVVMVGSPVVPGLTGGLPASVAPATYRLLRTTLHFRGVAMTDALNAGALVAAGFSGPAAAKAAISAGADMAMVSAADWRGALHQIEAAMTTGALSSSGVEASVTRILSAKHLTVCPG